jgi:selenoprotein W-related protein
VKRAAGLAEQVLHDYHRELPGGVTLIPGSGGVFEVSLGERLLFSKKAEGRFPEPEEVLGRLEAAIGLPA